MKKFLIAIVFLLSGLAFAGGGHDMAKVKVNGMVCDLCAQGIKKQFKDNAHTEVDLDTKTVTLHFMEGKTLDDAQITAKLKDAGYDVKGIERSRMGG